MLRFFVEGLEALSFNCMRHEASGLKLLVYEALSLSYAGWRAAFFVEGLAMLPVAALCFLVTNGLKSQVGPGA